MLVGPETLGADPEIPSPILKPLYAMRKLQLSNSTLFMSWSAMTLKLCPFTVQPLKVINSVSLAAVLDIKIFALELPTVFGTEVLGPENTQFVNVHALA